MNYKRQPGFTLLELMIVTAIIGVLGGLAYPSYQSHIETSRRSDAKKTLLTVQLAEEKWRANNTTYTTDFFMDISKRKV